VGVRKNAKFLTAAEREAFVKASVLMKAEVVNPAAPPTSQYSRWDEYVAIHRMIQTANAPGTSNVNFGHGGSGAYSFLSWHRYFLHRFEQQLQSHVPGVMLPYWDWTDPAPLLTDTFLGPNGSPGTSVVSRGYFAPAAPGTPGNPTPAPAWWPPGLTGWRLIPGFGTLSGSLRRRVGQPGELPNVTDISQTLAKTSYPAFQNALESGTGLSSGNQMHNGLHGFIGGPSGQMSFPMASPFDPIFYLHHCNIDRLWAMWQADGHATEYPATGGRPEHRRGDIMYPWVGMTPGYSTNVSVPPIVMPDLSALGVQRNRDTLDYRAAYGYTYDCLPVIGIGLDRAGSMNGLTPDPMTTGAPDVTKWEAARRGVAAFLQDCETVQASGTAYVTAGVNTFRSLAANDFTPVFAGTPYGLVKTGGSYSRTVFESNTAAMTPGGGTPLADALLDVQATLVAPPYGGLPADETRYLAMLSDGMLTSGAPLASLPDGSLATTVIFAMGFGTPADVDYGNLADVVAKGRSVPAQQVFHGENAGTIDKFYANALAAAIGFSPILDPVLELYAGEHAHLQLDVTSADDALFITALGMDFADASWNFHVIGPDGVALYGDHTDNAGHAHGAVAHGPRPHVTVNRANGRLSLLLRRNGAAYTSWVGPWRLMAAYEARDLDAMVMTEPGDWMFPVSAGPVRGPRYARLLRKPSSRPAARSVVSEPRNRFDVRPTETNNEDRDACSLLINVYAQTRLALQWTPRAAQIDAGGELGMQLLGEPLAGGIAINRVFGRLVAPTADLRPLVDQAIAKQPRASRLPGSESGTHDVAKVLARVEVEQPDLGQLLDRELELARHGDGPVHAHVDETAIPGVYHTGLYVEGTYCPEHGERAGNHDHHMGDQPVEDSGHGEHAGDVPPGCDENCRLEHFTRVLTATAAVIRP
jgi:Common central domain of tyrosinase